jgi:hypothetical protein
VHTENQIIQAFIVFIIVYMYSEKTQIFRISAQISVDLIVKQIFKIFGFKIIQAQVHDSMSYHFCSLKDLFCQKSLFLKIAIIFQKLLE